MPICPRCHQPIRQERFGVYLPPRKARIIDVLEEAGEAGVSIDQFVAAVWTKDEGKRAPQTVKSHISQLNGLIAESGFKVCFDRKAQRINLTRERKKVA
jgi:DNA-binding winged helix-turn-helix (wHTH) protein